VKPTTGGGIYFGLLSADIAADVLHASLLNDNLSASMLSAYQRLWQKKLKRELSTEYLAQSIYEKLSNNHIEYLFKLAKRKNIPRFIASTETFDFDWHRSMILQLATFLLPFRKWQNKL